MTTTTTTTTATTTDDDDGRRRRRWTTTKTAMNPSGGLRGPPAKSAQKSRSSSLLPPSPTIGPFVLAPLFGFLLESSWGVLEAYWTVLGPSWASCALRLSWRPLGPSRGPVASLGALWPGGESRDTAQKSRGPPRKIFKFWLSARTIIFQHSLQRTPRT